MTQPVGLEGQLDGGGAIRAADAAMSEEQLTVDRTADDPLDGLRVLDRKTATILSGVARAMYPHDALPDLHYQRVIAALDVKAAADATVGRLLAEGVGYLATTTGRRAEDFAELSEPEQVRALTRLQETTFFTTIAAEVVVNLYSQPDAWPHFGYEGPSNDKGGYLHRGFDDIDWLEDAPDRRGEDVPTDDGTVRETAVASDDEVPA